MSKTKIEWTDTVWNPVVGCSKISAGCTHCYAERMANRLAHIPATAKRYAGVVKGGRWTGKINTFTDALDEPRHWRKPRMVFVDSMSDLFHERVPFAFILCVYDIMIGCPQHTFQILTKRPDRALEFYRYWENLPIHAHGQYPPKNIWLGVSAENQQAADERIPILLQIDAAVRFVSCEPSLGPVDMKGWIYKNGMWLAGDNRIDLVIAGGETGSGARPMHPNWARWLREQCQLAGASFFFKSWGEWLPDSQVAEHNPRHWPLFSRRPFGTLDINGEFTPGVYPAKFPVDQQVCMYRVGRRNSGGLLDGQEWHQLPARASTSAMAMAAAGDTAAPGEADVRTTKPGEVEV